MVVTVVCPLCGWDCDNPLTHIDIILALVESTDGEAIERPTVRRCVSCGVPTDRGRWCSTACHKADEPGAYEDDE